MNSYLIWHPNIYYNKNYFPTYKKVLFMDLKSITSKVLKANSKEYRDVKKRMGMEDIEIIKIIKIENGYLHRSYELKREQKEIQFGGTVELYGFHGTTESRADGILTNNFNWRFFGQSSHHCFNGEGVYFSNDATISRRYPKKCNGARIMFLVKILVQGFCIGNKYMKLPPQGKDTSVSRYANEIVKYEDNEFYPCYQIIFNIIQRPMNENLSLDCIGSPTKALVLLKNAEFQSMVPDSATSEDNIEMPSLSISSFFKSNLAFCSNYDEGLYDGTSTDEESEDHETSTDEEFEDAEINQESRMFVQGGFYFGIIAKAFFNTLYFIQQMLYFSPSSTQDETNSDSDS